MDSKIKSFFKSLACKYGLNTALCLLCCQFTVHRRIYEEIVNQQLVGARFHGGLERRRCGFQDVI
jgi:hypothetical protein